MVAPNELLSTRFDRTAFGYRPDQVDEYMNKVGVAISRLMEENRQLEDKLEILAAKVEEYRSDEESLRAALLGAQKLGDSVIRDSKNKAEIIIRDATVRAERLVEASQTKLNREQSNLTRLQKEVSDFKAKLLGIYKQHLEVVSALPELEGAGYSGELPLSGEVVLEHLEQPATPAPTAEPAQPAAESYDFSAQPQEQEAPEPQAAGRASRFGELRFGKDFSLTGELPPFMNT